MAGIKHAFTSPKADGVDPTIVRPSNWNDDHTITGNTTWGGFNITNVGALGIGMTPVNVLDITKTQNAASLISLLNASVGVAASASMLLSNLTHYAALRMHGTGFTTSGSNRQDGALLVTNGVGGFSFDIPSDSFRWYIGGVLTTTVGASGLVIGSTILSIGLTASGATTNNNMGAASGFQKNLVLLSWNGGSGMALLQVTASGTVNTIFSNNGAGGDNCFDTVNGAGSNGGQGISAFVTGGNFWIQCKTSYAGGDINVHRIGG